MNEHKGVAKEAEIEVSNKVAELVYYSIEDFLIAGIMMKCEVRRWGDGKETIEIYRGGTARGPVSIESPWYPFFTKDFV